MPVNKNKLGKAKKSRREISSSLSCDSNFGGQDQIFMGLSQEEPYKKQKSNKYKMNSRRPNLNGPSSHKSREQRSREVYGEIDDFYRKNLSYDPSSYNSRDAGKYGHSAREEYFDHENNQYPN